MQEESETLRYRHLPLLNSTTTRDSVLKYLSISLTGMAFVSLKLEKTWLYYQGHQDYTVLTAASECIVHIAANARIWENCSSGNISPFLGLHLHKLQMNA